ncbi:MAG: hypothetical protein K5873_01650 [Treponema sp.]|nr:hypothetical protein [Treponema sp.]
MKSNVCDILKDQDSLKIILAESEKAAAYADLNKKESGRLRLLSEELIGMLPEILSYSKGKFWIESRDREFELHTELIPDERLSYERREELLKISKSGKNNSSLGIMNKIRLAAEFMLIDYAQASDFLPQNDEFYTMGSTSLPFYQTSWTLSQYRKNSDKDGDEGWDELEKSIIANIADDVIVGIQGKKVEVILKKNFNNN